MISKALLHQNFRKIGEGNNIDESTLRDAIITGYQNLFDLLKTMLSQLGIPHNLPENQKIIALERGIYPDGGEPVFFDYFGSTHTAFCEKHNVDQNQVRHLYKLSFSGGSEIKFSTKKFTTDRNIIFLDTLRSQLLPSQQPQLDPIIF
ncbi:MAG: hypothetical protein WCO66_01945 [Candidatus Absconditabacteria bacterium]